MTIENAQRSQELLLSGIAQNTCQVLAQVYGLLLDLEGRNAFATTAMQSAGVTDLDQDFDLLCQTIAELRDMFARLSQYSETPIPVSYSEIIAPIKLERLRALMHHQDGLPPSLRPSVRPTDVQLF